MMDNRPIGIFDSGVGGLTVVSEVVKALPNESIVYFGDTARVPYGSKSKETVTKFSRQIVNFLVAKGVKAIVAACNTVCSNCYEELTAEYDIPIIDVVSPGISSCLATTKSGIVGVIGTEATIRSGAYERGLKEQSPDIKVYSKACPLFVPLVEEGWTHNSVASVTTEIYLQELIDKEIDCLLLGCTHYPLLYDCIKRTAGSIEVVNPSVAVARRMKQFLEDRQMLTGNSSGSYTFYVSDNTEKFRRTCKVVLKESYVATAVDISQY